eukprot:GHVS01003446.1.p1 GENE.GHVS01003446.1~~GHVS01003446.1.p1  ORF type:complete len:240 (+),score=44.54 GHVS01003446.1:282-1001(+)
MTKLTDQRYRQQPHVDGNYPTIIYIPVSLTPALHQSQLRCIKVLNHLTDDSSSPPAVCTAATGDNIGLHLSLSKLVMLRYDFIEPFVRQLKDALSSQHRFAVLFSKAEVDIFPNELFNRFFAAIPVDSFCTTQLIGPLVNKVNEVLRNFGLSEYYEESRPHLSLASTTNESITTKLPQLDSSTTTGQLWKAVHNMCPLADEELAVVSLMVKQVYVKIGKVVTKVDLDNNGSYSSSDDSS